MQISSIFSSFRFPGKVVSHKLQPNLFLDLTLGSLSFFIGASQTNTDGYNWWISPSTLELSLSPLPLDEGLFLIRVKLAQTQGQMCLRRHNLVKGSAKCSAKKGKLLFLLIPMHQQNSHPCWSSEPAAASLLPPQATPVVWCGCGWHVVGWHGLAGDVGKGLLC